MPSLEHEALVDIVRTHPDLVPELLQALGVAVPTYCTISVSEASLDQLTPTEFRADLVVELRDGPDEPPRLSVVLEVQLGVDGDKRFSWPAYLTLARARRRCDTCVLVMTPDPAVAAWASEPIRVGPGNDELRVLVLGPRQVPTIVDPAEAVARPALAVLSALAHGNEPGGVPVICAALEALATFDSKLSQVYLHLIYKTLDAPMRRALETQKMLIDRLPPDWRSPDLDRLHARFREEDGGRSEARGATRMLFKLLDHNGVTLTAEQRDTIAACRDLVQIDVWHERAFTAKTAADVLG